MLAATASSLRSWAARRKALLGAVIRVATKPVLAYVTGDQNAADAYGDLLGNGLSEALDLALGKKESSPDDDGLHQRLEAMARLASALLDKLEKQADLANLPSDLAAVEARLNAFFDKDDALRKDLGDITRDLREEALAIPRVERKLEEVAHHLLNLHESTEQFKQRLIDSPLFGDWQEWRRSDPEAIKLLNEADAHFLAGRRAQGIDGLKKLFGLRGVGNATLALHLGVHQLGSGDLVEARKALLKAADTVPLGQRPGTRVTPSAPGATAWRSLPRGFEIGGKYRIEAEVGRGGMASVYRAVGIDDFNAGEDFAIKVPAPGLLKGKEMIERFGREIAIARKLSDGSPAQIVLTLGYERFTSPFDGATLYALVMEYIDGENLAAYLERRKAQSRPLSRDEVVAILTRSVRRWRWRTAVRSRSFTATASRTTSC